MKLKYKQDALTNGIKLLRHYTVNDKEYVDSYSVNKQSGAVEVPNDVAVQALKDYPNLLQKVAGSTPNKPSK